MEPEQFITVFTILRHCYLSWVMWFQPTTSHPTGSLS